MSSDSSDCHLLRFSNLVHFFWIHSPRQPCRFQQGLSLLGWYQYFKNNDNGKLHNGVNDNIDIDSGLEDNDNHGESLKVVFCRLQIGLYFALILTCFCSFAFFPPPSTIQLHKSDKPWYLRKAFKHDWSVVCCQKKTIKKKTTTKSGKSLEPQVPQYIHKWTLNNILFSQE